MKHAKDPSPLAASDAEIARLFAALDTDAPPPDARAAILARLDGSRPPLAPPSPVVKIWVLRGGVVLTGILGIVIAMRAAPRSHDVVRAPVTPVVPVAPAAEVPHREGLPATPPLVAVEDLPAAPPPRAAPASTASAGPKDSFREQLALVQSARHLLAEGNADECLTTLRRYDATYPSGLFTTEVQLVRIDALVAAGQPERAQVLARELLASDPHGAYADRLHSLFPQIGEPDR